METNLDTKELKRDLQELERENEQLRSGYASLSRRLFGLRMMQHIALDLVSELDVDRLLRRILRSAIQAVEGMAGAVILLDAAASELNFAVVAGDGARALQGRRMAQDQGVAGWVISHNEPVIISDIQSDPRFLQDITTQVDFEVTSIICAPLVAKGDVIGAVQVLNKAQGPQFDDDDLDLMTSFAAQSAAAIENARLYQELNQLYEDLKWERDRIIAIEEDIRRRLARDLHDGPAQLLAAIIVSIEFVRKLLELEPAKVLEELDNLVPLAQKALRQLRTLLFDLRPVILETQGLVPALESYVERQQEAGDLVYILQTSGFSERLVPRAERALFSIVQEAVGNVKKHAQAQHVWIAVTKQDGHLLVGVRDDGRGFDVEEVNADYDERGSLGMLNMQERAASIGGRLRVQSTPGEGTTITLSVPLAPVRPSEPSYL
jgi:signal transduction histidine kinase